MNSSIGYLLLSPSGFPIIVYYPEYMEIQFLSGSTSRTKELLTNNKIINYQDYQDSQTKVLIQFICLSYGLIDKKRKSFILKHHKVHIYVLPYTFEGHTLLSCILTSAANDVSPASSYSYDMLSYSLITALLGHTSAQLLKLIVDYTQFQEDKLKDSTFNDSVGDGEHSLEDLYHQYDIIDDIHTFEDSCLQKCLSIQEKSTISFLETTGFNSGSYFSLSLRDFENDPSLMLNDVVSKLFGSGRDTLATLMFYNKESSRKIVHSLLRIAPNLSKCLVLRIPQQSFTSAKLPIAFAMRFEEELSVLLACELSEEALQSTMTSISTIELESFTHLDSMECKIYETDLSYINSTFDHVIKEIRS